MTFPSLPLKKLILLMMVLQIAGAQARPVREPVQEFENDTKIFRNGSIRFAPEGIVHSYLSDEILSTSSLTLLSKQFLGEKPIEKDTSDGTVKAIRTAYQVMLSFETAPEKITKIQDHEAYVRFLQKYGAKVTEIEQSIEFYKEKGEWGPIITSELQREKEKEVIEFKNLNNQFLLRHTLAYSSEFKHVNGTVVLYPGNNWKILEEDFSTSLSNVKWEVGHLQYEIFVDKGILHIIHIGVESLWRSKGIGYAIAQYFTHFCCEHFSQVSDLTVNCRNGYSENIFTKCGFKESTSFEGATHHLSTHPCLGYNFEDGQKLIPAFHRSGRTGYLTWLNENYTKFFPKRLHKTDYRY